MKNNFHKQAGDYLPACFFIVSMALCHNYPSSQIEGKVLPTACLIAIILFSPAAYCHKILSVPASLRPPGFFMICSNLPLP
jgi:hypothetical protein